MEDLTFWFWAAILETENGGKRYRGSKYGHFWSQKVDFGDQKMVENVTGVANTVIFGLQKLGF